MSLLVPINDIQSAGAALLRENELGTANGANKSSLTEVIEYIRKASNAFFKRLTYEPLSDPEMPSMWEWTKAKARWLLVVISIVSIGSLASISLRCIYIDDFIMLASKKTAVMETAAQEPSAKISQVEQRSNASVVPQSIPLIPRYLDCGFYLFHIIILMALLLSAINLRDVPTAGDIKSIHKDGNKDGFESAETAAIACRNFLSFWPFLWACWIFLYSFLFIKSICDDNVTMFAICSVAENVFNNCTAVIFYALYVELSEITVGVDRPSKAWIFAVVVVFVFAAVEVATSIIAGGPGATEATTAVSDIFSVMSGIAVAVCTGLFVLRMGTRTIDVPTGVVILLIVYIGIQPLFSIIANPQGPVQYMMGSSAVVVALYSKVFLLGLVSWLVGTHRLAYYMLRERQVKEEESAQRKLFVAFLLRINSRGKEDEPTLGGPVCEKDTPPAGAIQ